MAQSAFLCSLFETVCSARSASVFGAPSDFGGVAGWTDSGLTLSGSSAFGGICPLLLPFCPGFSVRPRTDVPANCRYGSRCSCFRHGGQELKGGYCRGRARDEGGLSMSLASIVAGTLKGNCPFELRDYAETPMALRSDGWLQQDVTQLSKYRNWFPKSGGPSCFPAAAQQLVSRVKRCSCLST